MALLHELPTRSPGFELHSFLHKLDKADVLVGREPIEPSFWSPKVFLEGNFDADKFTRFANDVVLGRYLELRGGADDLRVEVVGRKTVRGNRRIILETLVKAFYVRDLLYELNECSTWFEKEDFARALRTCLSDSHDPHCWSVPSVSMMSHFQQYALAAQNSESGQPLGEPDSHLWYLAIKKDFE